MFVIVLLVCMCMRDLQHDNKSTGPDVLTPISAFIVRLSQVPAALCCCYCLCSSVHEPLRRTDTALSDILRLTPLITEVYTQIHKQSDAHSFNESARGNKYVFLLGENDSQAVAQKSALITFLMKTKCEESSYSV